MDGGLLPGAGCPPVANRPAPGTVGDVRLLLQTTRSAPATEVDVEPGVRARDVRTGLSRLTGDPRWSAPGARLAAGPRALDDEHPCGTYPLLAGAELRLSRGPTPPDETALLAPFHLAVVAGPDCGALVGLGAELVVGRGPDGPGRLRVADPTLSRDHVRLHARRGHVLARDLRTSNGTVLARADRRGAPSAHVPGQDRTRTARPARRVRRLGARAVRLRTGDRLHVGSTVLELRGPRRRRSTRPDAGTEHAGTGPGAWLWLGSAAGSAALAVTTGNPVLLVGALLGPVLMLAHAGRARVRRSRRTRAAEHGSGPGGSPHARPAAAGTPPPPSGDDAPLTPADLATATVRACVPDVPDRGTTLAPDPVLLGCAAGGHGVVVAVLGPRPAALAAARALALGLVGPRGGAALLVRCDGARRADWRWARWLAAPPGRHEPDGSVPGGAEPDGAVPDGAAPAGAGPGAPSVVLVDGPDAVARTPAHDGSPGSALVLVVDGPGAVPAWCPTVLEVTGASAALRTATTRRAVPLHAVTAAWAETQARRVAGVRAARAPAGLRAGAGVRPHRHGEDDPLPRTAALGDLLGVPGPDPRAVADAWAAHPAPRGLRAPLGVDDRGTLHVDLVADGPHALVAGTTGAGKSALLQTLVLSLALAHPPERLAVALVDYKGGASFGALAELPHVVGQVTDLDGSLAGRALAGLRAELHRRERLLADAGVTDVEELAGTDAPPVPRLLVVVDEFRALADEVPTFVPGLLRLAAQGRALGIHLVLATQRPGGAVGPDLRANIALRVALRVADAAESTDVLGVGDAAAIHVDRPGRAVLRRGNRAPEELQVALPHGPGRHERVRLATPWLMPGTTWVPASAVAHRGDDDPRRYVDAVRAAARGRPAPVPPWLPELPLRVTSGQVRDAVPDAVPDADLDAAAGAGTGRPEPCLLLGLGDVPHEQRRSRVTWRPLDGHLLVTGGPGSGRSSALRTVAHEALALGWDVHAVGFPAGGLPASTEALGTVVGPDDPRRLARLVRLLARRPVSAADGRAADVPQLLLLDGLDAVVAALDRVARGAARELLVELLRDGRSRGVAVAASSGTGAGSAVLHEHFRDRLVLGPGDRVDDVLAGVPAELAGGRRPPGRAVHVATGGAVLCQVAEPEDFGADDVRLAGDPTGGPTGDPTGGASRALPAGAARPPAVRLVPVPTRVELPAGAAPAPRASRGEPSTVVPAPHDATLDVAVGRGGDGGEVLGLDVRRGALVVGPPGAGRTTALAVIASALVRAGREVAVVADDAPLAATPGARWTTGTGGLEDLLGVLEAQAGPVDVVVDDLDALEQTAPHLVERLVRWLGRTRTARPPAPGVPPGSRILASATTARAATAYREPLAALRGYRSGLVLQPHEPGSGEVFGTGVEWALDPALPRLPGRGVLVTGAAAVPVQVACRPAPAPASTPAPV